MSLLRYISIVSGATVAAFGLAWGLDLRGRDGLTATAASFGLLLAAANTIAAQALASWAEDRPAPVFMAAVLGGMVGRMALVLGAVALGVGWFDLPRLPLIVGLLPAFAAFLTFELALAHRRRPSPVEAR